MLGFASSEISPLAGNPEGHRASQQRRDLRLEPVRDAPPRHGCLLLGCGQRGHTDGGENLGPAMEKHLLLLDGEENEVSPLESTRN